MKEDKIYINHIIECIEEIKFHLKDGIQTYYDNATVYKATIRSLHELSETCQRLSDDLKTLFPEIEWNKISGFRNILVHEYLGEIDDSIVLGVINNYLPNIKLKLLDYYIKKYKEEPNVSIRNK